MKKKKKNEKRKPCKQMYSMIFKINDNVIRHYAFSGKLKKFPYCKLQLGFVFYLLFTFLLY